MREVLFLLFTPIVAWTLAATLLGVWLRDRSRKENAALALGWFLTGAGFMISQAMPAEMGRITVAITHAFYTTGATAIAWGILHRAKVTPALPSWLLIAGLFYLAMFVSIAVGGSVVADLYLTNMACGLIFFSALQLLLRRGAADLLHRILIAVLVVVVAQFFIRPTIAFMFDDGVTASNYRDTVYYSALHATLSIGSLFFGLTLVTIAVRDMIVQEREATAMDPLSGLLARREFEERVAQKIALARQGDVPLALVVGDIDHFKRVNDIWGHQVGDRAIAAFGELLSQTVREYDVAGRVGGEEFCVLVWNADEAVAASLAERLRLGLSEVEIEGLSSNVRLTASFGAAEMRRSEGYPSLFARADRALYLAKGAGRNRVACAGGLNGDPSPDDTQPVAADSLTAAA